MTLRQSSPWPSIVAGAGLAICLGAKTARAQIVDYAPPIGISALDGKFSARLIGRVEVDFVGLSAQLSNFVVADRQITDIRRGRIGVEGGYGDFLRFRLGFDTPRTGPVQFDDAFVALTLADGLVLVAGEHRFLVPLEERTPSRFTNFNERANFLDAFNLDRHLNAALIAHGERWLVGASIGTDTVDLDPAPGAGGNERLQAYGRVDYAAIRQERRLVHLGATIRWREARASNLLSFGNGEAGSQPFFPDIVDTAGIGTSDLFLAGEFHASQGPFYLQGEYGFTTANILAGESTSFQGGYVGVGWVITGEPRAQTYGVYSLGRPAFGRPRVRRPVTKGGPGQWEVSARVDILDSNGSSPVLNPDGIDLAAGGRVRDLDFGLVWYPTPFTRASFQYSLADVEGGRAAVQANPINGTAHLFSGRLQFDF